MGYGWRCGVLLVLAMLAGEAWADEVLPALTPAEAIAKARKVNGRGVKGQFVFEVKGVGLSGDDSFLHSEADYRDPRSLNIRLAPGVREQLEARLGGRLGEVLIGRRVLVRGAAVRVRIDFVTVADTGRPGNPTGRFYYQTHVNVKQAEQVEVI